MSQFNSAAHMQEVLQSFDQCENSRFKEILQNVTTHLHQCVSELKLTPNEWIGAIEFLTQTGQTCTDKRQEFILLSDLLGVSTLTVGLNQQRHEDCLEETVEGPYYWQGAPELPFGADISEGVLGEKALYQGRVLSENGEPISGALLDVWSGDGEGNYDMQNSEQTQMRSRGKFRTDENGYYQFWSIKPNFYPIPMDGPAGLLQKKSGRQYNRPGHVHFKVSAENHRLVNTQLYINNGPYLANDCVFGVKNSLMVDYVSHEAGTAPDGREMNQSYYVVPFDFRLTAIR